MSPRYTTYLYGVSRIGELQPGGFLYHLADALGSVRQLVDASGALSWLLGLAIATPISQVMTQAIGQALFRSPIPFAFDWSGVLIWLGGVVAISAVSSILPAWHAVRLTVWQVLAYE